MSAGKSSLRLLCCPLMLASIHILPARLVVLSGVMTGNLAQGGPLGPWGGVDLHLSNLFNGRLFPV